MRTAALAVLVTLGLAVPVGGQDPAPAPAPAPATEGTDTEKRGPGPDPGGADEQAVQDSTQDDAVVPPPQETGQSETPPPAAETVGSDAPAPQAPAVNPAVAAPDATAVVGRAEIQAPLAIEEIERQMREIAARHPEVATLEVIGRSAAGREILVLSLSDRASGPAQEKPGMLVSDHQAAPGIFGAELALELAWTTAEKFTSDPGVQSLLRETALVVAPALDPDVRVPSSGPELPGSLVQFDRNFPLGWQPESLREASGRYPMSRPETRAVALFLERQTHLVLALSVVPARPNARPFPGAELPPEDREVMSRLAGIGDPASGPRLVPWHELGSPGGGFLDYAYQARGIFPLAFSPPSEEELASAGLASWLRAAAGRAELLLAQLPRLSIAEVGLERLAPGLWQLDVSIRNEGQVPTLSILGARRAKNGEISLALSGAKLVATARRPVGGAAYQDASFHETEKGGRLRGGTLAGGEERSLRLVVEGEPGAMVDLSGGSTWTANARLSLVLPQ